MVIKKLYVYVIKSLYIVFFAVIQNDYCYYFSEFLILLKQAMYTYRDIHIEEYMYMKYMYIHTI